MQDLLIIALIGVVWYVFNRHILPRMGVAT